MMDWLVLTESSQLEDIVQTSYNQHVIIYKHSTRCGISGRIKAHLESHWTEKLKNVKVYYLDLLSNRRVSDEVAERFRIDHESPQVLLLKNGNCTYSASHSDITVDNVSLQL